MATKTKKKAARKNAATKKVSAKKVSVKKKTSESGETPVLEVWIEESYVHCMTRGPISISAETHPELKGMSLEEMKDYVRDNAHDMAALEPRWNESLRDELMQCDVVKDKYMDEMESIFFNN